MHICGVPKSEVDSSSMTTHTIQMSDPFNATHPLIILLQLSGVTSYFDMYSPSIVKHENEEIPKIHLTAEEAPCDRPKEEYSGY